nr:MAG TPA: hypothetical protein [Caudoviricetes sp.]
MTNCTNILYKLTLRQYKIKDRHITYAYLIKSM